VGPIPAPRFQWRSALGRPHQGVHHLRSVPAIEVASSVPNFFPSSIPLVNSPRFGASSNGCWGMGGSPGSPADVPGLPVTALQIENSWIYVGVTTPFFAISLALVVARLVSRWRSAAGIALDDYLIAVAAVSDPPPPPSLRLSQLKLNWASIAVHVPHRHHHDHRHRLF